MKLSIGILFALLLAFPAQSDINLVQRLDFGNIVVANNDVQGSIYVDEFGTYTADSIFRVISPGRPAIYQLTGLPPNTTVNVGINIRNSTMSSDTPSEETFEFSLVRFGTTVLSDENGEAELRFGGRITTSGSGIARFSDTNFTSEVNIIIN